MGLFSSKKKIFVDSVTYNMAGDYVDRMNYLPTVTVGAALGNGSSNYIGESNTNSLVNGPAKNQINLLRWARNHYAAAIPYATLGGSMNVNDIRVTNFLQNLYGYKPNIRSCVAAFTDVNYWGRQYAIDTYGDVPDADWIVDIASSSGNQITQMVFNYRENPTETFNVTDCYKSTQYLYIEFFETEAKIVDKTDENGVVILDPVTGLPEKITVYLDKKLHMHIYRYGSNVSADMEATKPSSTIQTQSFMPFMPIRLNKKFINEMDKSLYYDPVNKYYKRATGGKKVDTLIKELAKNDKIDDINYAYVVYGVALNTKRPSCKRYLFAFFDYLSTMTGSQQTSFSEWKLKVAKHNAAMEKLYGSVMGTLPPGGGIGIIIPPAEKAALEADLGVPSDPPTKNLSLIAPWLNNMFNITLSWAGTAQTILSGDKNPKKKVGEAWLELYSDASSSSNDRIHSAFGKVSGISITRIGTRPVKLPNGDDDLTETEQYLYQDTLNLPVFTVYRQVSEDHAIAIDVLGLCQSNHVYKDKSTYTDSDAALTDKDECDLLVPMHINVLKNLSLKHRCQVCTENMYIIFNCYKVQKIKWYQKGIFKILIGIVLAIATVFFAPAGSFGFGLLGSNLAVGSALGLGGSVLVTAVVGSIVNAMAAMIVSSILTNVVGKLFKGTFGAIFGAIFGLLMGSLGNLLNGMNITTMLGQIFNPRNILNLTQAVMKAAGGIMQNKMLSMQNQMQDMSNEYEAKTEAVNAKMAALKGTNGQINTSVLAGGSSDNGASENVILNESRETFLRRTLMTLCDVAALDKEHISSTVETGQSLPEAFA